MRVVGGTEYISIAKQQKYFQWVSTDFASETCTELLENFLGHICLYWNKIRALGFGNIVKIFLH